MDLPRMFRRSVFAERCVGRLSTHVRRLLNLFVPLAVACAGRRVRCQTWFFWFVNAAVAFSEICSLGCRLPTICPARFLTYADKPFRF